jgi:hypothetical protein
MMACVNAVDTVNKRCASNPSAVSQARPEPEDDHADTKKIGTDPPMMSESTALDT